MSQPGAKESFSHAVVTRVLMEERRIQKHAEKIALDVVHHFSRVTLAVALCTLAERAIVIIVLGPPGIPGRPNIGERINVVVDKQPELVPRIQLARMYCGIAPHVWRFIVDALRKSRDQIAQRSAVIVNIKRLDKFRTRWRDRLHHYRLIT